MLIVSFFPPIQQVILENFDCRTECDTHNNGIKKPLVFIFFSIYCLHFFLSFFLFSVRFFISSYRLPLILLTQLCCWYVLNKHTKVSTVAHFRIQTYILSCGWRKKERKKEKKITRKETHIIQKKKAMNNEAIKKELQLKQQTHNVYAYACIYGCLAHLFIHFIVFNRSVSLGSYSFHWKLCKCLHR